MVQGHHRKWPNRVGQTSVIQVMLQACSWHRRDDPGDGQALRFLLFPLSAIGRRAITTGAANQIKG
jgi:hypothetical protein